MEELNEMDLALIIVLLSRELRRVESLGDAARAARIARIRDVVESMKSE